MICSTYRALLVVLGNKKTPFVKNGVFVAFRRLDIVLSIFIIPYSLLRRKCAGPPISCDFLLFMCHFHPWGKIYLKSQNYLVKYSPKV